MATVFKMRLSVWQAVIGRIISSKEVHILIIRVYEYVTFHGKEDLADLVG